MWKIPIQGDPTNEARTGLAMMGLRARSKERDRQPTDNELGRLVDHFRSNARQKVPMWDIIPFAAATAMRLSEIVGLRWDDLNRTDRTVLIRDRKNPRACNALGIVDLHFHDLRHQGTSRLFEMGYDIPEVAVLTGHERILHKRTVF